MAAYYDSYDSGGASSEWGPDLEAGKFRKGKSVVSMKKKGPVPSARGTLAGWLGFGGGSGGPGAGKRKSMKPPPGKFGRPSSAKALGKFGGAPPGILKGGPPQGKFDDPGGAFGKRFSKFGGPPRGSYYPPRPQSMAEYGPPSSASDLYSGMSSTMGSRSSMLRSSMGSFKMKGKKDPRSSAFGPRASEKKDRKKAKKEQEEQTRCCLVVVLVGLVMISFCLLLLHSQGMLFESKRGRTTASDAKKKSEDDDDDDEEYEVDDEGEVIRKRSLHMGHEGEIDRSAASRHDDEGYGDQTAVRNILIRNTVTK